MSTHPTSIRNGIANYVLGQLDLGTGDPTPRLLYWTAGGAEVATLLFDGTKAFPNAVNGSATATNIAEDSNATGGVVTQAVAVNKDVETVLEMTAGEATGVPATEPDITLSTATIPAGSIVRIASLQYIATA